MTGVLTVRTLTAIKPGKTRQEIRDSYLPGLYFVVQPTGAKSWAIRYRNGRRTRKHTLGSYPGLDLKSAREMGAQALRAVAVGRDPGQEKAHQRSERIDSINHIAEQFIELHCKRTNRPRTAAETERLLRLHVLPRWRARTVDDITRRDVLDLLDRIVGNGTPIAANRVFSAIRKFFSWCVQRDIIAQSPCTGIKPPTAERSRDRVLTDDELRHVWHAADKIGMPFGIMIKFLILTGQRRDEVARMSWSELDLDRRLWTLPATRVKNNRPHEVPLSDAAISVLKSSPRIAGDYVLTTTGKTPASGYSKGKKRLDALLPDLPAWRLHDLRRSVASGMAKLGINLPVIEKILNHTSGSFSGIVSVYQRHTFADEKRAALEAWGRHIEALVNGKSPQVAPFRGKL
jgi:integrase